MSQKFSLSAVLIMVVITWDGTWVVTCYETFQERIPNGGQVPHPCKEGEIWGGVGHKVMHGGGQRNPFGDFFEKNGKVWSEAVCRHDSDGDGLTNGQELGDPDCIWTPGQTPNITEQNMISHPGICTPWDSPHCQANSSNFTWVTQACEKKPFDCPALKEEGIIPIDVRIPASIVPVHETTYVCMEHVLPSDDVYHMVASTPIINNTELVHHILLFGCRENKTSYYKPGVVHLCGMAPNDNCNQLISIWGYGMGGFCLQENVGTRVGAEGFPMVAIQIHWNNLFLRSNMIDSSGVTLHLTRKLRLYDSGVWMLGSNFLKIPPQVPSHMVHSTCSPYCSRKSLLGPINVTGLLNHMHYLGKSMRVELVRNGTKLLLAEDVHYNYDSPYYHSFPDSIIILPGDEVLTTCVFNSMTTNATTYFGDATSDEMCFALLSFYPIQNMRDPFCTSWKTIPQCELNDRRTFKGCDLLQHLGNRSAKFADIDLSFKRLVENCDTKVCRMDTCLPLIRELKGNPCFQGDMNEFSHYFYNINSNTSYDSLLLLNLFKSCDDAIDKFVDECQNPPCSGCVPISSLILFLLVLIEVLLHLA